MVKVLRNFEFIEKKTKTKEKQKKKEKIGR